MYKRKISMSTRLAHKFAAGVAPKWHPLQSRLLRICKGRAGCQIATLFERSLIDAIPTFPEKAGRAAGAASLFLQISFARWRTRMTGATRLSFAIAGVACAFGIANVSAANVKK